MKIGRRSMGRPATDVKVTPPHGRTRHMADDAMAADDDNADDDAMPP